ncbi:MAG: glutamine amidotransferase-related protein [Anaerolineae bacterium]
MYIYVRVMDSDAYDATGPDAGSSRIKARLEQASGVPCLIVPYERFDLALVQQLKPRAIAMSGFGNHWQTYKVPSFWGMDEVLHQADLPIICFCGSHQLLGFSFNRDLRHTALLEDEPMRRLAPGEEPRRASGSSAYDLSDYFVADGFYYVHRLLDDPLFRGLPEEMLMRCSHFCEVKTLPPGFVRLATGAHCDIEAMRHETRPLYGTQFHPEAYEAPHFHGRTLLENFAAIVDDFWRDKP